MQAIVKTIQANDILEWPNWNAQSEADEYQWFTVSIGTIDTNGGDDFQVAVTTPRGLKARRNREKFQGIVVSGFTPEEVEAAIKTVVNKVSADSWEDIVEQLKPRFIWEYEGHL